MKKIFMVNLPGLSALAGLFLFFMSAPVWAQTDYSVAATPDWVRPLEIDPYASVPEAEISSGQYYQLFDTQILADPEEEHWYSRIAIKIVSRQGLENAGQFSFSFDPLYERAELHKIEIIRDGKTYEKLESANIQILQREEELEYHLYDGRHTLTVFVDDVRVGDILVYSYSTIGSNPVFDGRFFSTLDMSWSVPIGHVQRRILWPGGRTLNYHGIRFDMDPVIKQSGAYQEYVWELKNVIPVRSDEDLPGWYSPYAKLQLSEVDSWEDVVSWALPLYAADSSPVGELKEQIDRIASSSLDPAVRVMEVLKFVQGEVRYLGIELGVGGQVPRAALTTLQNRYGDCKDKTMLMVSMLQAMGIEAVAAFVDTKIKGQIASYSPSPALFNHVIVRAVVDGRVYWLDPTLTDQVGSLSSHMPPDYRIALVAAEGIRDLEEIPAPAYVEPMTIIEDEINISGGANKPGTIKTKTTYLGPEADRMRNYFSGKGLNRIQEDYVRYYTTYYPTIVAAGEIGFHDDQAANIFTVTEEYTIEKPWEFEKDDNSDEISIYAYSLYEKLNIPAKGQRSMPLAVSYPANIRHSIKMTMPENFALDNQTVEINDSAFQFKMKTDFQDPVYTVDYELVISKDHVPPGEAEAHIANIEQARNEASLGFYVSRPGSDSTGSESVSATLFTFDDMLSVGFLLFLIVGIIIAAIGILHGARSDEAWRDDASFYPVSVTKFIILSFASLGFYHIYWFYKNWQYYRDNHDDSVWPFWRAVFGVIWFYSLLKKVSDWQDGKSVLNGSLIIILPILYVIFSVSDVITDRTELSLGSWSGIMWLVVLLVPVPVVIAVNKMNVPTGVPIRKNSRFGPVAITGLIFGTPLFLFFLSTSLHLNVAGEAVQGRHLQSFHLNYLQDLGVLEEGQVVEKFYSNGFASIESDGQLITDQGFAVYWQEDDGKITTASARYEEFEKVALLEKGSYIEDSVIRVTLKNGGYIQFLWPVDNGADSKLITLLKSRMPKTF